MLNCLADGGDLKIDLADESADPAQRRVEPSELLGRSPIERPRRRAAEGEEQALAIAFAAVTSFHAGEQLSQDGQTCHDAVALPAHSVDACVDSRRRLIKSPMLPVSSK